MKRIALIAFLLLLCIYGYSVVAFAEEDNDSSMNVVETSVNEEESTPSEESTEDPAPVAETPAESEAASTVVDKTPEDTANGTDSENPDGFVEVDPDDVWTYENEIPEGFDAVDPDDVWTYENEIPEGFVEVDPDDVWTYEDVVPTVEPTPSTISDKVTMVYNGSNIEITNVPPIGEMDQQRLFQFVDELLFELGISDEHTVVFYYDDGVLVKIIVMPCGEADDEDEESGETSDFAIDDYEFESVPADDDAEEAEDEFESVTVDNEIVLDQPVEEKSPSQPSGKKIYLEGVETKKIAFDVTVEEDDED
jgi:hypothetical protein